jgi:NhaA family Na+:H+ antiporter
VLAVVGRGLPSSLRVFLLTLAVVDDLIVIVIIAAFYTSGVHLTYLLLAVAGLVVFALLQKYRGESWLWYVPLSIAIWWFTHESGIHATIAGVAMGLLTRVRPDPGEEKSPAERLEHTLTPLSAGVAVPFFALMSAGVAVDAGTSLLRDPVVIGVALGLLVGKPLGVFGGSWIITHLTRAELHPDVGWRDIGGVAVLAGVGFTVALLVAELSYEGTEVDRAKTAVLGASLVSALVAAVLLRRRGKAHRRAAARQ